MADQQPPAKPPLSGAAILARLGAIGAVVAVAAGAFAWTNGTLDRQRITPARVVDTFEHNNGQHPGYRRNHPKGVCVAGYFQSSGAAAALSSAEVFAGGRTPVTGRFALPSGNPYSPDNAAPIRSLALRFTQSDGQQWRTGMNSMPVFPIGTPEAFYEQLKAQAPDPATGKPDPAKVGAFFAAHPESAPFREWAKTAKPSPSYVTETYNGINAFYLVDGKGQRQAVRWAMVAQQHDANPQPGQGDNYLEQDLQQRLAQGEQRWDLVLTLAEPGDPTNDASKSWPAGRRTVNAGTLVLTDSQPQLAGDCRDINYDPLVLPNGIEGSDDPLLAARSAAYSASYRRRTGEVEQLPKQQAPAQEKKS